MHCKYCNENSIIFDLVEAMEFDYIVVGARRVKYKEYERGREPEMDINSRSQIANPTKCHLYFFYSTEQRHITVRMDDDAYLF